jgi:UDP-N-acetyl-D-mannosaminuronic acid dehydrogenase
MEIGIIGGCGHIGLPLSLILAKKYKVTIIDPSKNKDLIKKKISPFYDEGIEKYLNDKTVQKNIDYLDYLHLSKKKFDTIIITLGTPIDEWSNPISEELIKISLSCKQFLNKNGIIILRSTLIPGLSKKISKLLKKFHVFYCPERIVQGKSFSEMFLIPQIISYNKKSNLIKNKVKKIFYFSPLYLEATFEEAELIKLFNNFYRYCSFAISNQMYLICENYNVSFSKILKIMKYKYPRAKEVPGAGLAAGPCLYKDTLQLSSLFFGNFAVGNAAIQTNERLADYLSNKALKNSSTKKIVILGAAFKANCDDFRSSLSFKILKNLKRQSNKKILLVDPYVNHPKVMQKINFDFKNYYFILATPHKSFEKIIKKIPKKSFLNVWND